MGRVMIADLAGAARWLPVASGEAELRVDASPGAVRMEFDFKGGGGFVVARGELGMALPELFAFLFRVRGEAPPNKLEFKVADRSGKNVWRWEEEGFEFTASGREVVIPAGRLAFAWGPAGGGLPREAGAVEFAICAPPGGRGVVWIEGLRLEDRTPAGPPVVSAWGGEPGSDPAAVLLSEAPEVWRAAPGEGRPWLMLDFGEPREYGGLVVTWGDAEGPRTFGVEASDDLGSWRRLYWAGEDRGARSFVPLPGGMSRFVRLVFETPAAVRGVEAQPLDFARTDAEFFHSVAARSPRGWYPRYWLREQSYWTCCSVPEGGRWCALINEEGMVEPGRGSFSVEPFLEADGRLVTWADAEREAALEGAGLPLPFVRWRCGEALELETACRAGGKGEAMRVWVRYRVRNGGRGERRVRLYAAVRPFQVTPPWQAWRGLGGVSRIGRVEFTGGAVGVDGRAVIVPGEAPEAWGAAAFEQGEIAEWIAAGRLPQRREAACGMGYASGAMRFAWRVPPGGVREVFLEVRFCADKVKAGDGMAAERCGGGGVAVFEEAARLWRERLGGVEFAVPEGEARAGAETFRTAAGHILAARDGAALQPGPRRYTRSWIRDGVMMGAALMRAGDFDAMREFLEWYAPWQREDGFVPCCVDGEGPDWLVEHDSHGQFVFGVREVFRFTGDRDFLARMWPHVLRAARFVCRLRRERMGPEYEREEKRDRYGLLPESASHEGYLAHPVHAYWDDFWALRGLRDAAAVAAELGREAEAGEFGAEAGAFAGDVRRSIERVIAERGLDYVPGSVEWADFDPTATANAAGLLGLGGLLPRRELEGMFAKYLRDFRRKRAGEIDWANYTAYELRIISALTRLGWREEALELARFFLGDQRPGGWNQWPEISWRDPRAAGHLGDLPHAWIASEWVMAFAGFFAFEREEDGALVLGAGLDGQWLEGGGAAVRGLPTWFGRLDFAIRREGAGALAAEVGGGLRRPPGGVVLRPPLGGPLARVWVNGREHRDFSAEEVRLAEGGVSVRMECEPAGGERSAGAGLRIE